MGWRSCRNSGYVQVPTASCPPAYGGHYATPTYGYAHPVCPPASVTSSESFEQLRSTLGVSGGPSSLASLQGGLTNFAVQETTGGGMQISFRSTDTSFRLGYATQNSFTSGGSFTQASGRDQYGRPFQTTGVSSEGYNVSLTHNTDGSVNYTITINPNVTRARLDLGGRSFLIDREQLLSENTRPIPVPKKAGSDDPVPDGVLPVPDGVLPKKVVPDGVLPKIPVPDGVLPKVPVPDGVLPKMPVPDGRIVPDGKLDL